MGIIKNSITFGSGFNITAEGPIDSRMVVEYIEDLTNVWNSDAPAYEGMMVSVLEDGNVYVVEDRGGMASNVIDVFFNSHQEALNFGVKYADVYYAD